VTGFPENNDANSYFLVIGAYGEEACQRGSEIQCGSKIRLQHMSTRKYLHSHLHKSPLSNQQEVSCYEGQDTGDNWKVHCVDSDDTLWGREREVRFEHVDTGKWLSSSERHKFRHPIPGQQEIYGSGQEGSESTWIAQEGIYFASPDE
jgi:dolichyl-phosphate-mannose--protein O-mannosyl transferase